MAFISLLFLYYSRILHNAAADLCHHSCSGPSSPQCRWRTCNHRASQRLSLHSQEFMCPAIDPWRDAQDRGHGSLTSALLKAASLELYSTPSGLPAIPDTLSDVIPLWPKGPEYFWLNAAQWVATENWTNVWRRSSTVYFATSQRAEFRSKLNPGWMLTSVPCVVAPPPAP